MPKSVLVALRINRELKAKIDKLVNSGKFQNFSDVVRTALIKFLESEDFGKV